MSAKDYLVQNMVSELVGYLMKDFGWDIQSAMRAVYHSALFQKLDDAEIELYTKGEGNQFEREKFQERLCEEEEKVILIFGGIFYEDMIECVVCPDCGETMIVQHDIDNYRCLKCQNVFQMEEMA